MAWKPKYKKTRKPEGRWSEDAHVSIATFCTIAVIFGIIAFVSWMFPPDPSSASPTTAQSRGALR